MTVPLFEHRGLVDTDLQFRAAGDLGGPRLEGYAAVFDRLSLDLGGYREQIDRAAFNRTLKGTDVVALWEHDTQHLLGRTASGTLSLAVDDHGLAYRVDLPDTGIGRDVAELARRGDIRGSSFGFRKIRDRHEQGDGGEITRTLLEVQLIDVSPVTRPAYPDTDAVVAQVAAQFSVDPAEVRSAIETRSLGTLIFPAPPEGAGDGVEDEQRTEDDDEARQEATPVVRPLLLHLHA